MTEPRNPIRNLRRWPLLPSFLRGQRAWLNWRYAEWDGVDLIETRSPLPLYGLKVGTLQTGSFKAVVAAARLHQDRGIGIHLPSTLGLACYRLENAYRPDQGTLNDPALVRTALEIARYSEFTPDGQHISLLTHADSDPGPAAVRQLGLTRVGGFLPVTGHTVHLNSVVCAVEHEQLAVHADLADDDPAYGPSTHCTRMIPPCALDWDESHQPAAAAQPEDDFYDQNPIELEPCYET